MRRLEEREYEAADLVAVLSPYARQTFVDRGFAEERLGMHGYGFDPGCFPEPADVTSREGEGLRAVFVGRCEPRKGLHYALEAWIESGAAERGDLHDCGTLPGYARCWNRCSASERDVQGWVDDTGKLMREATYHFPSVRKASLRPLEAQASGAVVVSDATEPAAATWSRASSTKPATCARSSSTCASWTATASFSPGCGRTRPPRGRT